MLYFESEYRNRSAKGAKYESQGQARSASPLDQKSPAYRALKGRNTVAFISALQALIAFWLFNQGRRASRLPLAFIFRAFGAVNRGIREVINEADHETTSEDLLHRQY